MLVDEMGPDAALPDSHITETLEWKGFSEFSFH